jgi:hypothetical protein
MIGLPRVPWSRRRPAERSRGGGHPRDRVDRAELTACNDMVDGDLDLGQHSALPLACTLGPEDGRSRLLRWQRLHEASAPVARLVGGRLEVRYQPGPGVRVELAELAAAEQTCCSFATWSVSEVQGHPVLHVVSPADTPEAVAFIAALFGVSSTA